MLSFFPYYLGLLVLCVTATDGSHGSQTNHEKKWHLDGSVPSGNEVYADTDDIVGELSGTHKLTSSDILNGFRASDTNYVEKCDTFSKHGDNFVLTVEMGKFADHLIPEEGVTLCDLLTTAVSAGRHRHSPADPRDPAWDGYSRRIRPPLDETALGGSAVGFVDGGRETLSFWGDGGADEAHTGGCCATLPGQAPRWYRPYRLRLHTMENAWYMSLGSPPILAVVDALVMVEVKIWDMRGKIYNKEVKLDVTVNGDKQRVTSSSGRYELIAPKPKEEMEKYEITVELVDGPDVKNSKKLTVSIPVEGKLPFDVTPCDDKPIPNMLHFGNIGSAFGPVEKNAAFEEDWFATTVEGGSAHVRPVYGQYHTVEGANLAPFTFKWVNATSNEKGIFVSNVPCQTLQFYAFAIYSAAPQRIFVEYTFGTAAVVYLGEKLFAPQDSDPAHTGTIVVDVSEGYHQVLVELYSDDASSKDSESCTTTSQFSIRVLGTAVGYAPAVMPEFPEGAYELWSNGYLSALLYLGKRNQFQYGGLNEDLINVKTARPKRRQPFGDDIWRVLIFMDGRIPVNALNLPADKEAAILYTSFSIFNQYKTVVPLKWTFEMGGHTELYIDGTRAWGRGSEIGTTPDVVTTPLSSGWHQIIVRAAATRGQSWILRYSVNFDGYRIAGDINLGTTMPFGVVPIKEVAPIHSLLSLQSKKTSCGAISFDPTNATTSDDSFSDFPIDSSYKPSSLSTQDINVLSTIQTFEWVPKTNEKGVWSGKAFGGNFNQYWALSLYATEKMEVDAHIFVHGGFALWLDGDLKGVGPVELSKEYTTKLSLSEGWHQVIVKLKANNSFHLLDTNDGTTSWTKANAICSSRDHMELCALADVCPFGVPRPGALPVGSASSFAPVSDRPDEWVQVFAGGGDQTKICQSWRDAHNGSPPPWGEKSDDVSQRRYVPCCGGIPHSSMWVRIEPPASGELGFTYDIPLSVESPIITIKNAAAVTQTVTIATKTLNADIEYTFDSSSFKPYKKAIKVTKDVVIIARALKNGRVSRLSSLSVTIPKTQTFDRTDCVANANCPLVVQGVDPGSSISILTTNIHGSKSAPYKNKTYASQQEVSTTFSGVLLVGEDNDVIVPPLDSGTFQVFVYAAGLESGIVTDKILSYRRTKFDPREVLGSQETLFRIQGGVMVDDAVFLPFKHRTSSAECSPKTCLNELKDNKDRISLLTSNHDAYLSQDLRDFSGELRCMCLCLSCSTASSPQSRRQISISDGKVISQAISVNVIAEPLPSHETVNAVRPVMLFSDSLLELSGVFDTTASYAVQFAPAPDASAKSITPSCAVQRVTFNSITCRMTVHPGTMGNWNVLLIRGKSKVSFAPGAVQVLRMYPPAPKVTSASGLCAMSSASCVNGAVLTLYGTNFNPNGVAFNEIKIGPPSVVDRIRCDVTEVSDVRLSCTFALIPEAPKGTLPISVRIRISPNDWSSDVGAGFLVLGAGPGAVGWQPPITPQPSTTIGGVEMYTIIIILSVLFALALLAIFIGVCLVCCGCFSKSKDKEYGDEMLSLDEQLLRAGRESVQSLHRPSMGSHSFMRVDL